MQFCVNFGNENLSWYMCHSSTGSTFKAGIPTFIIELLHDKEPSLHKVYGLQILRIDVKWKVVSANKFS